MKFLVNDMEMSLEINGDGTYLISFIKEGKTHDVSISNIRVAEDNDDESLITIDYDTESDTAIVEPVLQALIDKAITNTVDSYNSICEATQS